MTSEKGRSKTYLLGFLLVTGRQLTVEEYPVKNPI